MLERTERSTKLRWRIECAFNRLKDFRRIPSLCLPRRRSCMVDLISLDPNDHARRRTGYSLLLAGRQPLLRPEPLHQDVLAIANGAADLDVRWAVPAHSGLR
jgi:hypothetical protein